MNQLWNSSSYETLRSKLTFGWNWLDLHAFFHNWYMFHNWFTSPKHVHESTWCAHSIQFIYYVGGCCDWEWGRCRTGSASLKCSNSKATSLQVQDGFFCKQINNYFTHTIITIVCVIVFCLQNNPIMSLLNTLQASGLQPPPWIDEGLDMYNAI